MEKTSLTKWERIADYSNIHFTEALILPLTNGEPYFSPTRGRFDFTHDLSIYVHSPKKIDFDGSILEIDASLSLGEYETERATLFACSFRDGLYVRGFDYDNRSFLSLGEARQRIPEYLGISLQDFLKLFQINGMSERCRQGIRDLLE